MSFAKLFVFCFCFATFLFASPQASPAKPGAATFKPFTGKVVGNKVRLRVKPDIESPIFRQVGKNDLLLVVGEEGDFFSVQPPKDTKAYVFRSYILDNTVEASRVNVRLEPHVDGPIIGILQAGDKVTGKVSPLNNKWLEITPPASTCFYVSKEFIANIGGPDVCSIMEKKKIQVDELLHAALLNAETEGKKPYEEMSSQMIVEEFQTIIRNFSEFPEAVNKAKEALINFKDIYIQKKINYLEAKAELSSTAKDEMIAKYKAENRELFANINSLPKYESLKPTSWESIEESLYLSWTAFHTGKKMDEFYAEQKANAIILSGRLETYDHPIKNRPGDFLLRDNNSPIAYLYSTAVDLSKCEGKRLTLLVSPRPNNHFAFPAYFVLSIVN